MRFTEYLIEAIPQKPRLRPQNGRYVMPAQKQQQPRGKGGKYTAKPALDPMAPRQQQSVDFQNQDVDPIQPQNKGKPRPSTGDTVNFHADPSVQPVQPKNKPPTPTEWQVIMQKAGTDNNAGREFMTLLGDMYQAKRRNPNVQLELPKLVTSLPDKSEDELKLKKQMTSLFKMAQNEDLPQLAARVKQLQDSRRTVTKQNGNAGLPPKAKGQAVQPGQAQANAPEAESMLQQLSKLSLQDLKKVGHKIKEVIKNKKPQTPNIPAPGQQRPNVMSTG